MTPGQDSTLNCDPGLSHVEFTRVNHLRDKNAVLYCDSDDISTLNYDPSTQLVHVKL